jgi:hypothetical protein
LLVDNVVLFVQRLLIASGRFQCSLARWTRKVQTLRERCRELFSEDAKEARGVTLLREWLSPEQLAEFDGCRHFEVIGCDSGKRYRIRYGTAANVHELDDAGHPRVGWCFVPAAHLVAGDVMLAQKIALETNEVAALAVANRFPVELPRQSYQIRR